ncbi:GSCOCG00011787001-RA-CDS [Cotesia congregata]|nr:GSCOCG00011787001-RA-CDS [Cotesia congregata]
MNDWKDIRYGDTLREFSASPGFTELKVNEELSYLDKGKDYQQSTERLLAGLANAVLTLGIIEWANQYPDGIGSQNLINMFNLNFGKKSETFRNSERMLQIFCGKRASYIEARRERIINEAPNKQVQGALKRIPPCPEYLLGKEKIPRRDNFYTPRAPQISTSTLDQSRPQYRKIFTKKDSAKPKQLDTFRKTDSR